MCGRYTYTDPNRIAEIMLRDFGVIVASEVPRFNVAPGQSVTILRTQEDGRVVAQAMRWGLIPAWDRAEKPAFAPVNLRSEGISGKKMFRQPLQSHRVLFAADGFYEWRPTALTGTRSPKTPYYVQLTGGAPFVIAGVAEEASDIRPEATCALLTTSANQAMTPIHHRMPVILDAEAARQWMRPGPISESEVEALCRPYPAGRMAVREVSTLVNNVRNDGPELLVTLPTLFE